VVAADDGAGVSSRTSRMSTICTLGSLSLALASVNAVGLDLGHGFVDQGAESFGDGHLLSPAVDRQVYGLLS
jgi:hypothetical protein